MRRSFFECYRHKGTGHGHTKMMRSRSGSTLIRQLSREIVSVVRRE